MYNPKWFREDRLPVLLGAIDRISFGTLVTSSAKGMLASHVPMLAEAEGDRGATIVGHIAKGNLQWRDTLPGSEALAMFLGPDAYISPGWYRTMKETGEVVPTWDYIAVHARGPVTFYEDESRLRELVARLTEKFEGPSGWSVSQAPASYISKELKMIVGFEVKARQVEGKWKMSQNRSEADALGAVKGLEKRGEGSDLEVAKEIQGARDDGANRREPTS